MYSYGNSRELRIAALEVIEEIESGIAAGLYR